MAPRSGALHLDDPLKFQAKNCTFTKNVGQGYGAGLSISSFEKRKLKIVISILYFVRIRRLWSRNIHVDVQNISVVSSQFEANNYNALYFDTSEIDLISDCVFKFNYIPQSWDISHGGGAIYAVDSIITRIEYSSFIQNTGLTGGALNVINCDVGEIISCDFLGNTAAYPKLENSGDNRAISGMNGGAIAISDLNATRKPKVITNCTFKNNGARGNGEAIYRFASRVIVRVIFHEPMKEYERWYNRLGEYEFTDKTITMVVGPFCAASIVLVLPANLYALTVQIKISTLASAASSLVLSVHTA